MGIEEDDDDVGGRRRSSQMASQAVCSPELRTIELNDTGNESNVIFFPKCVRVNRCGGCCGTHFMECVPTKISFQSVRRAQIR